MHTIQTMNKAFEVFIDIVNLHDQAIQRYLGQQSNLGELPKSVC